MGPLWNVQFQLFIDFFPQLYRKIISKGRKIISMKQPCLSNCYGQMSGCSGNRRVPVCFDVKLEPFLDTNLIFSRADYNSRKSNKNRCVFHLLSVMYQLTENKQNTMMLCENATITWTETPEQRRYVWKLFLQLISWLSWIFPASYHPGLISYKR